MKISLAVHWVNAAWHESVRVGSERIERPHLYLGMLAVGGAAARLLAQRGITLRSARDIVRARTQEQDAPSAVNSNLPSPGGPVPLDDPSLPWEAGAKKVADKLRRSPDTYALIIGLLQDEDPTVRGLVAAAGVAPNELVAPLREGSDDAYSATRVPFDSQLLSPPAVALSMGRFVSTPASDLIEALSDPRSLAWWAYDPQTWHVSDGGERAECTQGRHHLSLRFHLTRDDGDAGPRLRWIGESMAADTAGQAMRYDDFVVTQVAGGCEMQRTMGRRRSGPLPLFSGLFTDQLAAVAMPHTTAAIASGAARR